MTYPLSVNLQGLAGVKTVRANSMFGFSLITIIFEEKIDNYFARTRVLERLNLLASQLPSGVIPQLGPDATGLGWVYQYISTLIRRRPRRAATISASCARCRIGSSAISSTPCRAWPRSAASAGLCGSIRSTFPP